MARLLVCCESPADFKTVAGLVDRVIREKGPDWLRDLLEAPVGGPEDALDWGGDPEGRSFFDIHKLSHYARQLGIRVPQGHFNGDPGAAGALMARTFFHVVRKFLQRGEKIDAVLFIWDMDDRGNDRRKGLHQARDEARKFMPFGIVLGCPDPMKEAWVLAGFEPANDAERSELAQLRQELGFNPCEEAHRLDAKQEQAKRNPKRVLHALTGGDSERESLCWTSAPLGHLMARGKFNGLAEFLGEVEQTVLPLMTGAPVGAPAARR
jgi:hypothetical protein